MEEFEEKTRNTHDFGRREGRLPEQRARDGDVDYRPLLHRDGSVLSAITLEAGPSVCSLSDQDSKGQVAEGCSVLQAAHLLTS